MPTQRFTLIVEGPDLQSEPLIDELFEAGCDDATIGRCDGVQYVDFDREATDLGAAVLSAVRDLQRFEGVHVTDIIDVEPAPTAETAPLSQTASVALFATAQKPSGLTDVATSWANVYAAWRRTDVARPSRPGSAKKWHMASAELPQPTLAGAFVASVSTSLRPAG
ncbi:MAG: hypothetical protein OXU63_08340 [Acidobacteriota bacterium]|nr:hypothetical protein [Acidobacteriota bacterium]